MIKMLNEPYSILNDIAMSINPNLECEVQFHPELKTPGNTVFSDDGKILINVSINIPFYATVEILAHELAHAILGIDEEEHGEKWSQMFDRIHEEYVRRVDERHEQEAADAGK
jgi:predicted SprT family Zn-dependent metalloprotease